MEANFSLTKEMLELCKRYGIFSQMRSDSCYTHYSKHIKEIDGYKKTIEEDLMEKVFYEFKLQYLLPVFVSGGKLTFTVEEEQS